MKRILPIVIFTLAVVTFASGQAGSRKSVQEVLKFEKSFEQAVVSNNAELIARFVDDKWIIIESEGGIIERSQFLHLVKTRALTHASMESTDVRVRVFSNTAVVTAVTTTHGAFMGQDFTSRERATDILVRRKGRWRCVLSQLTRISEK